MSATEPSPNPSSAELTPRPTESSAGTPAKGSRGRRWWIYEIIAVVVVVIVVVSVFVVLDGLGKGSGSGSSETLISKGTLDSIPALQFDAIALTPSTNSTVNGTIFDTFGLTIYRMTPAELFNFSRTDTVSGYAWTSGPIPRDSIYDVDVPVPAGAWDVVFDNPSPVNNTAIAFYSALTIEPT